jgi:hypothetical protein
LIPALFRALYSARTAALVGSSTQSRDSKGQDDLAVFRLLVVATQKVGDGPDKGGQTHALQGPGGVLIWVGPHINASDSRRPMLP